MLSLKSVPRPLAPKKKISILDLPSEVLDLIFWTIYHDGYHRLDIILPSSRVCRQFRKSVLPLMFETVSWVLQEECTSRGLMVEQLLAEAPHLLSYVRHFRILPAIDVDIKQRTTFRLPTSSKIQDSKLRALQCSLGLMPQLQTIRIKSSVSIAKEVLNTASSNDHLTVILDHIQLGTSEGYGDPYLIELAHLARNKTVCTGILYLLDGPINFMDDTVPMCFNKTLAATLNLKRSHRDTVEPQCFEEPAGCGQNMEEIWFNVYPTPSNPRYSTVDGCSLTDAKLRIAWHSIRRLSLWSHRSVRPMTSVVRDILPQLTNLEYLRLRADYNIFHVGCIYFSEMISRNEEPSCFEIDFEHLPKLRSVELEGICNHVPIENIVSSNLTSLKLHRAHRQLSTSAVTSQRNPSDLLKVYKIAPGIVQLELDIGNIENLWHPTAVPGVDVDVELYQFLNALGNFRRLKVLRLYPPYCLLSRRSHGRGDRAGYATQQQAVSDEQAIRIFNYLRNLGLRLEIFQICPADDFGVGLNQSFRAMRWEVRPFGDKTILTTRQDGKAYEQRQIWEGTRRLTMRIKKDAYHYTDPIDNEGWLLSKIQYQQKGPEQQQQQ